MLDEGVFRVEEHQVHQGGVGARRGETILVVLLDNLQVLLPIIAAGSKVEFKGQQCANSTHTQNTGPPSYVRLKILDSHSEPHRQFCDVSTSGNSYERS